MTKEDSRFWNRRQVLKSSAVSVPVALAGCTGTDSESEPTSEQTDSTSVDETDNSTTTSNVNAKQGGTLRWGASVPTQGLDPHRAAVAASSRVFEQVTQGLFQVTFDYELRPLLATDYQISDDGTRFTFDLREGVTFHDGTDFTSEDVKASFERIASGGFLASNMFPNVESMAAPDDYTFEIQLNETFAPMLNRMSSNAMHILPQEQAQKDQIEKPIGTGPFQIESREIGSEIVLTKHQDYWDTDENGNQLPYVDEVVKQEIGDDNVRLNRFRAGEVDFINDVAPKDIEEMKNHQSVRFSSVGNVPKLLAYLGLNAAEEPFDDRHARLAIDCCIDKPKLVEAAVYGHGTPTATPGFPGSPWETKDLEPRPQNFDKAKEHLDNSEYSEIDVDFKIPKSYNTLVTGSKLISQWASEVGINLNIQQVTWSNWLDGVYSKQNFKATMSTYLGHWYPDFAYYRFYHPEGAFYYTGWENEEYMQLVEDAKRVTDTEERAKLYHEANHIAFNDPASYILLYNQNYALASSPDYKGQMGAPDGMTLRFSDNWFDS